MNAHLTFEHTTKLAPIAHHHTDLPFPCPPHYNLQLPTTHPFSCMIQNEPHIETKANNAERLNVTPTDSPFFPPYSLHRLHLRHVHPIRALRVAHPAQRVRAGAAHHLHGAAQHGR